MADMCFVAYLDMFNAVAKTDLTANYPNLKKMVENVTSIESIKKWIANRPVTEF
jgi:prostaglandin-H2 D-isomerase / glutathione transferase